MAIRFAGAKSGNVPDFSPTSLSSSRVTSSAGSAPGGGMASTWGSIRAKSPKYDEIGATAADVDSAKRIAYQEVEAQAQAGKIAAYGSAARSKMDVDMYDDMTSSASKGGMMGLFGGIAGGARSLATGGIM